MHITILNGNQNRNNSTFNNYLIKLKRKLEKRHSVELINLSKKKIKKCTGCFGCWIKTPGECVLKDDTRFIRESYINSELVIYASPVIMGFTSSLLKLVQDKLIPLIHPYFVFIDREVHHRARYDKYPRIGLLLGIDKSTDDKDISIISNIYKRIAINFKSKLSFVKSTKSSLKELSDEVNHI